MSQMLQITQKASLSHCLLRLLSAMKILKHSNFIWLLMRNPILNMGNCLIVLADLFCKVREDVSGLFP